MFDLLHDGDAPPRFTRGGPYPVVMTASAHDIAAALRDRLPGLPTKKLHRLLYYCQGHHLATFGVPLFSETISAWDMGPVVGTLWFAQSNRAMAPQPSPLNEAQLNTVGYVVSRYGALSGRDLENLTHHESPWQLADTNRSQVPVPRSALTGFATISPPPAVKTPPMTGSHSTPQWSPRG